MNFDEFKQAISRMKRDGLINLAWELVVANNESTKACLVMQDIYQRLAEVSDFMAEIIEKNGLQEELKGGKIEQYKQSHKESHSKEIEDVKRAISLSNSFSIQEKMKERGLKGAKISNRPKELLKEFTVTEYEKHYKKLSKRSASFNLVKRVTERAKEIGIKLSQENVQKTIYKWLLAAKSSKSVPPGSRVI
ncbi:MAG: hypothetical protein FWG52_05305 [Proteobacteria bacterium]|nr:hypothetical protein [Pseudomonadota bacterium]